MNEFQQVIESFDIAQSSELAPEEVREKIQQYCVLLWHKNQKLNLTRHTDWETFVARDLVDTLQLSKLIEHGTEVLDVGSGGGVPGLLLAIIRPDLRVNLTESVGKKALALVEFAEALSVPVQVFQERAESLLAEFRYDYMTARAVGSLSKLCRFFNGHWINVGAMLATKGPNWVNEKAEAEAAGLLDEIEIELAAEYPTPMTDWSSTILRICARKD